MAAAGVPFSAPTARERTERLPAVTTLDGYMPFHGVRGALLAELGRTAAAREALERALALAATPAERRHLGNKLRGLKYRD